MAALDGIRVLDFGHYIAGPLAAQLLADNGAEVIRIDRPGAVDEPRDAFLQRGKQRITLDLKNPDDARAAHELCDTADVVIENFRPGVFDRLGFSAERLRESNPRLVVASMPGFAAADRRAQVPGWEGVIAAATGNCRVRVGEAPPDWDMTRPTYPSLPLASNFAAILCATAVIGALVDRETTGAGARVEVPLFDATFELIGGAGAYSAARGYRVEDPLIANGSGTYECSDGRYVQFNPIGATMRFLTWFLDAAGQSSWIAEGFGVASSYVENPGLAADLRARLTALFLSRPAQEWEDLGRAAGVPLCRIRTAAEWLETEHARVSGQVVEIDDPELGTTWMAGSPVHLSETPGVPPRPRTAVGGTRAAFGPLADPSGAPVRKLMGDIRVVDLTQILAGPSAGRMLAEYGADVVKVNAPQRMVEAHGVVNRGKASILLDLQRTEGQALLWQLIEQADVLTQNFPEGTAESYGFGYRHVHARRPDLVYVSVSCYGYRGPWSRGRGYEVQGQAVTGIMERTGRGGRPAVLGPYNPLDYGTGTMAAFAAALGIFARTRTGAGQHVSTSLAQVGTFHQATMLFSGADAAGEVAGRGALGPSALQRFYAASDAWVFVGAAAVQADALGAALGTTADEAALEAAIATRTAAQVVGALTAVGIGAQRVVRLPELFDDPYVIGTGLRLEQVSDEIGPVTMPGPVVTVNGARLAPGRVANAPGSDSREVLARIGREDDLAALESGWIVQSRSLPRGWPSPT
jgi:crotonobetainyl-CoA:carnitine CoA-transferase CaiB-like acyl-CoA transferase